MPSAFPHEADLKITGTADGVEATVKVTTNREEEEFGSIAGPPDLNVDGWNDAALMREDPRESHGDELIYVYSDIDAPDPKPFDRAYRLSATGVITIVPGTDEDVGDDNDTAWFL